MRYAFRIFGSRGISLDSLCDRWPEAVHRFDLGRGELSCERDWFRESSDNLKESVRLYERDKVFFANQIDKVDSVLVEWWQSHCALRNQWSS